MNTREPARDALEVRVRCSDLEAALDFYTGEPGFRLDMIMPADAPRIARLSGHGITLHLERTPSPPDVDRAGVGAGVLVQRASDDDAWVTGRAGMQYRDLVPGRLGGRLIASHIRIPDGGPVPDYVHYHHVGFQMIFCRRGWVRVVYEDQGPPFVMHPGDCVLQPPTIRHRVLESSPGLEVIELSAPADHETWRDHALELPTAGLLPERRFGGQRFVRHVAAEAVWRASGAGGGSACDTGIAEASGGAADVRILRIGDAGQGSPDGTRTASRAPRFLYVLSGCAQLHADAGPAHVLRPDDACLVPRDLAHALHAETACELLDVRLDAIDG